MSSCKNCQYCDCGNISEMCESDREALEVGRLVLKIWSNASEIKLSKFTTAVKCSYIDATDTQSFGFSINSDQPTLLEALKAVSDGG